MKPDFMNTRNWKNESITSNKAFMPPCFIFHVMLESLYSIFPDVLSENKHFAIKMRPSI